MTSVRVSLQGERLPGVCGVSLDAADTLFRNVGVWPAVAPLLTPINISKPSWEAAVGRVGSRGLWPEDSLTGNQRRQRWEVFYRDCLIEMNISDQQGIAFAAALAATRADSFSLFEDVLPLLKRLRASSIPICLTSNFDGLLFEIIEYLEIGNYLCGVVSSFEVGCYKPDARMFRAAAQVMNLPLERIVHIGDSLMSDYHGSQAAGMHPVLLVRSPDERPPTGRVVTISSLEVIGANG